MTANADIAEEPKKKGSKLPLILGIVLALAGGGGGFFAVSSGMIGGAGDDGSHKAEVEEHVVEPLPPIAFVALDPMIVSLPQSNGNKLLRFTAQLEVPPSYQAEVETVRPRIVDVLNGYLRAVTMEELADPMILDRLRSQMLRRVQTVAGEGRVRDLLIMEFVLN